MEVKQLAFFDLTRMICLHFFLVVENSGSLRIINQKELFSLIEMI